MRHHDDVNETKRNETQVIDFINQNFAGAVLREKQNAKMRFEFPPQESRTLAQMFGFIEVRSPQTGDGTARAHANSAPNPTQAPAPSIHCR